MNLHKRIFTTYVLNDDMKGLIFPISSDPADDYRMVFENITHAHFVFHCLYRHSNTVSMAHEDHGALRRIVNTDLKTDKVDAYEPAILYKNM